LTQIFSVFTGVTKGFDANFTTSYIPNIFQKPFDHRALRSKMHQ